MTKLSGANKAQLLDKMEDAMWEAVDEGTFSYGCNVDDLMAHLAVLSLKAAETHLALNELAELDNEEISNA